MHNLKIININGIELSKETIKNTILIAYDLLYYGYSWTYFYENYTDLLSVNDSEKLWNIAKNKICNEL